MVPCATSVPTCVNEDGILEVGWKSENTVPNKPWNAQVLPINMKRAILSTMVL